MKILLVDDHTIIREGLNSLFRQRSEVQVIGQASSGKEALDALDKNAVDVVIMDINLPDIDGIEATKKIREAHRSVKVLGLSMYRDKHYIQEIFRAGASGYLPKDSPFDELLEAVTALAEGKNYIARALRHIAIDDYIAQWAKGSSPGKAELTYREIKVLELIAAGHSTKEIAHNLGKSSKTIEACRRGIMEKLDLHSVAELTKYAIREGLATL